MFALILFGIINAIVARSKGFEPIRWVFALGIIGLIVLIVLPSAKAQGIAPEQSAARRARANVIGGWMCGIIVTLLGVAALTLLIG